MRLVCYKRLLWTTCDFRMVNFGLIVRWLINLILYAWAEVWNLSGVCAHKIKQWEPLFEPAWLIRLSARTYLGKTPNKIKFRGKFSRKKIKISMNHLRQSKVYTFL